ncbi:hypothetical protein [Mesoplasma melaleucae]|uniref:FAD synthase n=1 Tax=Mesoplasma melaleucae TaxID=81459 RepID=A0A2K8NVV4_9MOLU|nr:hypothetical protein [Mesoplasma melaleucae]ATZ17960.1 bifunctional riboflavin kinase/FMN adenylyltransferase [Mesoplasma melaleucae]
MEIVKTTIHHIEELNKNSCVTVGMFDALHKYHKLIIAKTAELAKQFDLSSIVITFNHKPTKSAETLIQEEKKIAYIKENFNIDKLIILYVDEQLINTSKEAFVQILKDKLKVIKMVEGSDFRFGYQKAGDINYLIESFGIDNIFIFERDLSVSTSKIKKLIEKYKIDEVEKELEVDINLLK